MAALRPLRQIVVLCLAIAPVCSQAETLRGRIKFRTTAKNFGEVTRGQALVQRFPFVNAGKGPLTIQGVHAACGCTAVEATAGKVYRPGEEGAVVVTLETRDFSGPLTKAVTVMTNEKVLPDRTLTLRAFVKAEVEVAPPLADFGEVRSGPTPSQALSIRPLDGFGLRVRGLEFNRESLEVRIAPVAAEAPAPGKSAPKTTPAKLVTISLRSGLKPGFLRETVIVRTNSRHLPELRIPVRATIVGPIEHSPAYLEFGAVSSGDRSRRSITLKSDKAVEISPAKTELIINGHRVADPQRYVQISTEPQEERRKLVAVELANVAKSVGSVHGRLIFSTSDERQQELAVDFYAFFR